MSNLCISMKDYSLDHNTSSRLEILCNSKERRSIGPDAPEWSELDTTEVSSPKEEEKTPIKSKYFNIYVEDPSIYDEIKEKPISVSIKQNFLRPFENFPVCSACFKKFPLCNLQIQEEKCRKY